MNEETFTSSLKNSAPPEGLGVILSALWWEKKGNWQKAHDLVEHENSAAGAWIHAYLHRVEGDIWNADYWYRHAGKTRPSVSTSEEWSQLVNNFLSR